MKFDVTKFLMFIVIAMMRIAICTPVDFWTSCDRGGGLCGKWYIRRCCVGFYCGKEWDGEERCIKDRRTTE